MSFTVKVLNIWTSNLCKIVKLNFAYEMICQNSMFKIRDKDLQTKSNLKLKEKLFKLKSINKILEDVLDKMLGPNIP